MSESHSEISTRVPFCIATSYKEPDSGSGSGSGALQRPCYRRARHSSIIVYLCVWSYLGRPLRCCARVPQPLALPCGRSRCRRHGCSASGSGASSWLRSPRSRKQAQALDARRPTPHCARQRYRSRYSWFVLFSHAPARGSARAGIAICAAHAMTFTHMPSPALAIEYRATRTI